MDDKMPFSEVSFYRGGFYTSGSPLWADIWEFFDEQEPFNNDIIQLIGHSQHQKTTPITIHNIRLLDNRQLYLLQNGELKKYELYDSAVDNDAKNDNGNVKSTIILKNTRNQG